MVYAAAINPNLGIKIKFKIILTTAAKAVAATVDAITDALVEGDKVALVGFGTFAVKERAARQGVNPRTGEKVTIAAAKAPAFKAGKALKDAVAK